MFCPYPVANAWFLREALKSDNQWVNVETPTPSGLAPLESWRPENEPH